MSGAEGEKDFLTSVFESSPKVHGSGHTHFLKNNNKFFIYC